MEFFVLYGLARRWIWLLYLCIAAGAVGAFLFGSTLPKMFESTSTLLVGHPFRATTEILAANRLQAQAYADLATLRPMLQKVVGAVGLQETPEDLAGQVLVRVSRTSSLLTITVTNTKPNIAAAIANALADELIALSPDPRSNSGPAYLANLTVLESTFLTLVGPAVPAAAPSAPKLALITALGAGAGLFVAVIVIAVVMAHRASTPQGGRVSAS